MAILRSVFFGIEFNNNNKKCVKNIYKKKQEMDRFYFPFNHLIFGPLQIEKKNLINKIVYKPIPVTNDEHHEFIERKKMKLGKNYFHTHTHTEYVSCPSIVHSINGFENVSAIDDSKWKKLCQKHSTGLKND